MWISKKKWGCLEKRVADLEAQVQSQQFNPEEASKTLKNTISNTAYHDKFLGGSWASHVFETSYTDIQTGDVIREIYGSNGQYKRVVLRDLKTVKTCELVDELKARTGVMVKYAEPHTYKNFSVNGPAVVLIITD